MTEKELRIWFEAVKIEYDRESKTMDMPEGDFNVLEAEYQMLEAILG